MKKLLTLAAVLALTAACGVRPSVVIDGSPGPVDDPDGTILYFVNADTLTRVIRPTTDFSRDNVTIMAEGTLDIEKAEGLTTEVPETVLPITRGIKDGTIELKVTSPVGTLSAMAQDQLICTALRADEPPESQVILTGPDKSLPPKPCPLTPEPTVVERPGRPR